METSKLILNGEEYYFAEGQTPGWQPGANTLVYLPLDGDANDYSGNSRDGTLPSTYSREYVSGNTGKKCFYVNQSQQYIQGDYSNSALGTGDRTISIRVKFGSILDKQITVANIGSANGGTMGEWFGIWINDGSYSKLGILRYFDDPYTTSHTFDTDWHNYVITYDSSNKGKVYVDGEQVVMTTNPNVSFDTLDTKYFIGNYRTNEGTWDTKISNFILEDKSRTAQEISDYFNQTKSLYGIS